MATKYSVNADFRQWVVLYFLHCTAVDLINFTILCKAVKSQKSVENVVFCCKYLNSLAKHLLN